MVQCPLTMTNDYLMERMIHVSASLSRLHGITAHEGVGPLYVLPVRIELCPGTPDSVQVQLAAIKLDHLEEGIHNLVQADCEELKNAVALKRGAIKSASGGGLR